MTIYTTSNDDPRILAMEEIGQELDGDAWRRLQESNPGLASAVFRAVKAGVACEAIKLYTTERTGKPELARWVANAARYLTELGSADE